MANDTPAPAPSQNPFDAAAGQVMSNADQWGAAATALLNQDKARKAQQIRSNVMFSVGQNPDQAAQYQHLAKYVGVPVETVHAYPDDIKQQAAMQSMDADNMVSRYPALAQYLGDANNAAKSHDDIAPLGAVEHAAKALPGAPAPAFTGPGMVAIAPTAPTLRDRLTDWWASVVGGPTAAQQRQAPGAAEANAILAARAADPSLQPKPGATQAQIDELNNRAWEQSRQAVGGMSQIPQIAAERFINSASLGIASPTVPTKSHSWQASTAGAAGSLAGFIAGPAKIAGAGIAAIPAAGRVAPIAGEAWATGLGKAMLQQAATLGLASGLQEVGSAALDSHTVGEGAAKIGSGAASGAAIGGAFGAAGKLLPDNTIAQWLGRTIGVSAAQDALSSTHPLDDRPLEDKLFGYGMNALFTMQGAGRTTGSWFTDHPDVQKGFADANSAQTAVEGAGALDALGKLASMSKTRERDPEGFKAFVRSATEDGQLHEVFVDANKFAEVLNQSGVSIDKLAEQMPDLAGQFAEAVHTNGDIRIPVEDYATHIAGGPVDAALLPHLKMEPGGMTYEEGQAHMAAMQGEMAPLAEKLLAEKSADDAAKVDAQAVHDKVLGQLDAAARFRPEVNKAYAAMTREFYATQAERAGITPGEMYERYPLKITAETAAGGFNQEAVAKASADIANLAAAAAQAGNQSSKVKITPAQDWLVQAAKGAGLEIAGFEHSVDSSAIRHVRKNHSDEAQETARGQLPVGDEDFARIPQIIAAPDRVIFGTQNRQGRDQIGYLKKLPDGSTLYLEEVRNGRKELAAQTMRKYPATMNAENIVSTLDPNTRSDGI